MFVLPICGYLMNVEQWSWRVIPSGIPNRTCRERGTRRHEDLPAMQAILAISTEVLGKLHPTISYLVPAYAPIVMALMFGCTTLAVRLSSGLNSDKCDGAQSLEDAA
jgi:hypothetical protein